jgi:hypothetical protein
MKYFTKEWHVLLQKTGIHEGLKEDIRASEYSEDLFNELYNNALNKHLNIQKNLLSAPYDVLSPPETAPKIQRQDASKYDIEKFNRMIMMRRECHRRNHDSRYPYDEQRETDKYKKIFDFRLTRVKRLPEEILRDVADIRVLALGKATKEIIERVKFFCEECEKQRDKTYSDYHEYYEEASKSFDQDMVNNMGFYECNVTGMQQDEGTLSLFIDNLCGSTVNQIIFKEYKIIKQDDSLINCHLSNYEVYKTDNRYEIHMLFNGRNNHFEFIVCAEKISFIHDNIEP